MVEMVTNLFKRLDVCPLLDSFYALTGTSVALAELNGTIVFSSKRPTLCAQFYDVISESAPGCRLSRMKAHAGNVGAFDICTNHCPHGLVDIMQPLLVNGTQIGALLIGQVFTEQPDENLFFAEAERYGFDVKAFMKAVHEVPVISQDKFEKLLHLFVRLVTMIAEQAQLLDEEKKARLKAERAIDNFKITDGKL